MYISSIGSIWYQSKPSEVPIFTNQYLVRYFIAKDKNLVLVSTYTLILDLNLKWKFYLRNAILVEILLGSLGDPNKSNDINIASND